MAYASGAGIGGLAGLAGAAIGGYFGYCEAAEVGMQPWQGAAILGGLGLVAGSAGAYLLKSAMQFIIFIVIFGVVAFFFRDQIEALTGIDPVDAVNAGLERFGLSLPGFAGGGSGGETPPT